MERKVREAVRRYRLLEKGDRVVVGVSGGADSAALLHLLCMMREEWAFSIAVCHVNHCLRGEESDRDEAFVRQICADYGVKLFCFTEDVTRLARETGKSVEEAAREVRYRRLEEEADAFGPGTKIATAHTLSDSMETMLFHLARGTGPAGLCGIPPVRGRIVRPLITVTRHEVEAYCRERGLSYVTDSTNLTDDYTRNLIRHTIVPRMYELNPAADAAFLRLTEILRPEEAYLDECAQALLTQARAGDGWRLQTLRDAHPVLLRRALRQLFLEHGVAVNSERILRLAASVESGADAAWDLGANCRFTVGGGKVRMQSVFGAPPYLNDAYEIADGISVQIGETIAAFFYDDYEHYKKSENIEEIPLKNVVDYDKIEYHAVVRTRRAGDRFSLPGRNWTKTLKKWMNEARVPPEERGKRLVCADSRGVFWVEGFGADSRAAVSGETKRVLLIRISKVEGAVS